MMPTVVEYLSETGGFEQNQSVATNLGSTKLRRVAKMLATIFESAFWYIDKGLYDKGLSVL